MGRKAKPKEDLRAEEIQYLDPVKKEEEQSELRETASPDTDNVVQFADPEPMEKKVNKNAGHRFRLRTRFREAQGFEGFSDHEILELLLTYGSPRKDTKDLAKRLLDEYGSLKCVFEARPEQLMKMEGVGEMQATLISMALPLARVCSRCEMDNTDQIANRRDLERYCKSLLLGKRVEEFWVICVNARCRFLGRQRISTGSLSEVSAYPRLVMEAVMTYNAHSVFFCHNHPGGTCAPSAEDIASTLQLQKLLRGVDVMVLDHMIIAGDTAYSMAQHGDIEFGARGR